MTPSTDGFFSSQKTRATRVLLVAPSLRYVGGQAVQAERLREKLAQEPWVDVDLLPVDPPLPGVLERLQRIKYVRTIVTTIAYVISLLRAVPQYDVIHAFSASYWSFLLAPVPAIIIGRIFGKKVILNYHSGEAEDHLTHWGWHAIPLMRLSTIVVQSEYLVAVFAKFGLKATAIPNFLDLDEFTYRARTTVRPRFLSNRNFEAHYDVASILRAFGVIQRTHGDATLDVLGDGPERIRLETLSRELGLRNVNFVGSIPPHEMPDWYDKADVFLNASVIDNMPVSIIEAFASGLPVATSNAGGIPYMVQHGQNGMLSPINDPVALAGSALLLVGEPEFTVGMAGRARVDALSTYTWDVVRDNWRRAYAGLGAVVSTTPHYTNTVHGLGMRGRGH
jgi:glycosyltransferase involved in cell wall biosynthesis